MDSQTEQKIIYHLSHELKDKTTLMITHRLDALLYFDRILVLEDGKISESGSHDELMELKGVYFNIFEQQKLEEAES